MKRILFIISLLIVIVGGYFAYNKYTQIFGPNVSDSLDSEIFYISTGSNLDDVTKELIQGNFIKDEKSFSWVAEKMKFGNASIKPGRYKLSPAMSNRSLINHLRSGNQEPVRVTIRAAKHLKALAGIVCSKLECDSSTFIRYMEGEWIPNSGVNPEDAITTFIPNTYEVYWNISPEQFVQRMESENGKFWNTNRKDKAESLGLSPTEVYTLASIVERETQNKAERSRIAGVYLNRLKKGMLLQADPTVIFAHQDFSIRRVLKKHLEIDSPYNTYKYSGLPPGPIYMPTIHSIDATLDAESHNYLFFCVNPETPGTHAFASTLNGHLRNARRYQQWANRNGIR